MYIEQHLSLSAFCIIEIDIKFLRTGILTKHLYMSSLVAIPGPENPPYMYQSEPSFHVPRHSYSSSAGEREHLNYRHRLSNVGQGKTH